MKKTLSLILAVVMLLGCISITAFAADDATRTCPKCSGEGTVPVSYACDMCRERGEIACGCIHTTQGDCPDCGGSGDNCETCHGTGRCPICNGKIYYECPDCHGEGKIFTGEIESCPLCGGNKTIRYVDLLGNITVTVGDSTVSIAIEKLTGILASGEFIDKFGESSKPSMGSSGNGIITVHTSLTESGTYSLRFTWGNIWLEDASIKLPDDLTELKITFDYDAASGAAGNIKAAAAPAKSPEDEEDDDDFITSFTLSKDYNDKYAADTKSTKVSETLTYTITPMTENATAFDNNGVVTMTVTNGVGSVEVALPAVTKAGECWYTIKENAGSTAGVTYDANTYYLHLVTYLKDGAYGVVSAAIHADAPAENGAYTENDKIAAISNIYGEGSLTVMQKALLNGAPNTEDTFTETVTFTTDKTVIGSITYGSKTITPDMWKDGSVSVDIDLKGDEKVIFENIPDGVTYTIVQKTKADGYEDAVYTVDDEEGDEATATAISGTISDEADSATVHNEKDLPIDVGVILENGAFIVLALGTLAFGAWLVLSKRKEVKYDAE